MFIELVDALRCPVPHEESWLVAAAVRMEARHIVEGTLGCPVCSTEYVIHHGVVHLRRDPSSPPHAADLAPLAEPDAEQAMRLAAMLGLADAQGFALLLGEWGRYAPALAAIADTPLILVDPPAGIVGSPGISVIRGDGLVPLGSGAARGTAVDRGANDRVASAARATRARGRIVAPIAVTLPAGVRELVRDETLVVGEVETLASPLVTLHVRRG